MSFPAPHAFEERKLYKARITDQMVSLESDNKITILLTVLLLGKLKDEEDPSGDTIECAQQHREVRITFVPDDQNRLSMAARDLERLGFADEDVTRLHPDAPSFFRLVDKQVFVRMKVAGSYEYWNLAWPREKPKPAAVSDLAAAAASIKARIADAKKAKPNNNAGGER